MTLLHTRTRQSVTATASSAPGMNAPHADFRRAHAGQRDIERGTAPPAHAQTGRAAAAHVTDHDWLRKFSHCRAQCQ